MRQPGSLTPAAARRALVGDSKLCAIPPIQAWAALDWGSSNPRLRIPRRTRRGFLLRTGSDRSSPFYPVPNRAFARPEHRSQFRELLRRRVGPASGHVVAIYNGQVFPGDPRNIPLTAHAQIQLEVGTPLVAPEKITFPAGL